jgi:hypothetical protein
MTWVRSFLDALQVVAKSPYAFVAYVCLLAGFIYWLVSQIRLKAIARLPAQKQAEILKREYNVFPRAGLSGDEWIRTRRQTLTFWAFVVLIVAVVLLGTIALVIVRPATPTTASNPAQTTIASSPSPGPTTALSPTPKPGGSSPEPRRRNPASPEDVPNLQADHSQYELISPQPGRPVRARVTIRNTGKIDALHVRGFVLLELHDGSRDINEVCGEIEEHLHDLATSGRELNETNVPVDNDYIVNVEGPTMSREQIRAIADGDLGVYVASVYAWSDEFQRIYNWRYRVLVSGAVPPCAGGSQAWHLNWKNLGWY